MLLYHVFEQVTVEMVASQVVTLKKFNKSSFKEEILRLIARMKSMEQSSVKKKLLLLLYYWLGCW